MARIAAIGMMLFWILGGFAELASLEATPAARLKQGVLLFAIPELRDPNFIHTVVLLVSYEREGAMGIIINRPTEIPLEEALEDLTEAQGTSLPLYQGGPVSPDRMVVLFRSESPREEAVRVFGDVYYTWSRKTLSEILNARSARERVRVYAGYAGWAPGQLENEVKRGDWVIGTAEAETIFSEDPSRVWPEIFNLQEQIEITNPGRGSLGIPSRDFGLFAL